MNSISVGDRKALKIGHAAFRRDTSNVCVYMHKSVHTVLSFVLIWLSIKYLFESYVPAGMEPRTEELGRHDHTLIPITVFLIGAIGLATIRTHSWKLRARVAGLLAFGHLFVALSFLVRNHTAVAAGLLLSFGTLGVLLAYSSASINERFANVNKTNI